MCDSVRRRDQLWLASRNHGSADKGLETGQCCYKERRLFFSYTDAAPLFNPKPDSWHVEAPGLQRHGSPTAGITGTVPIVSIVVPGFWCNQIYGKDPKR